MKTRECLGVLAMLFSGVATAVADDAPAADSSAPASTATLNEPAPARYWASVDYLRWRVKDGPVRFPLVVTGPQNVLFSGALDIPGTRVLFGGSDLDFGTASGMRFAAGMWLDSQYALGVEASGFFLEKNSTSFSATANAAGQPFLGRPFINALTGAQNVYFVSQNFSNPALSASMTGRVVISASTNLSGWEANGVAGLVRNGDIHVDGIVGLRGLALDEDFVAGEDFRNITPGGGTNFLGVNLDPAEQVAATDTFRTSNRFFGAQVGGRASLEWNCCRLGVTGKVALGVMCQEVTIIGDTLRINPAGAVSAIVPGGLFALPTNIGEYQRNRFAAVSEVGVDFGVRLCSELWARVGYNCLYASSVVRPGAQIDPVVNPNLVPSDATFGPAGKTARPAFRNFADEFWAHGLNLGLELQF